MEKKDWVYQKKERSKKKKKDVCEVSMHIGFIDPFGPEDYESRSSPQLYLCKLCPFIQHFFLNLSTEFYPKDCGHLSIFEYLVFLKYIVCVFSWRKVSKRD
jgi:hypothetical protein